MPQNFLACDREQELLLPPSLREWLAEDHCAWFVIDGLGELDLAVLYDRQPVRVQAHIEASAGPSVGGRTSRG